MKLLATLLLLILVCCQPSFAEPAWQIHNRAVTLLSHDHNAEAAALLSQVANEMKDNPVFELNYGWALTRSGHADEGVGHLKHSTELDSKNYAAWLDLGIAYSATGQPAEAKAAFQKYLSILPNAPDRQRIEGQFRILDEQIALNRRAKSTTDYLGVLGDKASVHWRKEKMPIKVWLGDGSKCPLYKPMYRDLLHQAFDDWQAATNDAVTFEFVPEKQDARIIVDWTTDKTKVVNPAEGGDTVYHHDGVNMRGAYITILLLDQERAKLKPPMVRWITLHEVGHALGLLGHSNDPKDIMYTVSPPADTMPELSQRDKNTMLKFYTR